MRRSGQNEAAETKSPMLWRIRHSAAPSAAAMLLFLVLSGLWLVAAGTAQIWYHSAPPGYVFASGDGFYVWFGIGISGALLTLVSLLQILPNGAPGADSVPSHKRGMAIWVVLAGCIGAAGELLVVTIVTRHSIATAPFGADSGEGAAAIAALGLAQIVLVGLLTPFLLDSCTWRPSVIAALIGAALSAPRGW